MFHALDHLTCTVVVAYVEHSTARQKCSPRASFSRKSYLHIRWLRSFPMLP